MDRLQSLFRHLLISLRYHSERLGLRPREYPRKIVQTKFSRTGIVFEVHNLTEANRVLNFDGEEAFLSKLLNELRADDVLYDVGACIGVFSLHAANHCRRVIAFEPEPAFRQHLENNVSLNSLSNVFILPYAIADRTSIYTLFTDGVNGRSPSLEDNKFKDRVEIQAYTLSELVLNQGLETPTIIKMDIEGAEVLALRGMVDLLTQTPPRAIFLELHPKLISHFDSSADEVLSLLKQAGYQVKGLFQRDEQTHYIFEFAKV